MLLVCVEKADVLQLDFSGVGLKYYQYEHLRRHVGQMCFVTVSHTEAIAE